MNQFIELTNYKPETRVTINVSLIIKVQPDLEGCLIFLSSGVNCVVKETYEEVLALIRSGK